MESWNELHARDAHVFATWPRSRARFFRLPVDKPQAFRFVLESDDAMLVGEQMVDDLAFEVGLLGQPHRLVVLLDLQESDTIVGAEDEVVVRAVTVIWLLNHASDHAERVEEAVRYGHRFICHLEKVELARLLSNQHEFVWLALLTHRKLCIKDYNLGNPQINERLVAGLETMINVPVEEVTVGAACEK